MKTTLTVEGFFGAQNMDKKDMARILFYISLGFLVAVAVFEYGAVWANQWATTGEKDLLSNLLQSTAVLNFMMFVVLLLIACIIADKK
jgi:hypothetical protein